MAEVAEKGSPHDRARIVRRYLSALDTRKPGRTAARTAETISHRMHQIDTLLISADPVERLHLTQERIDLHAEHLRLAAGNGDFAELEKAFVRVARAYGDRHDITYSAWRQVGVDSDVLAKAGIHQQIKVRAAKPGAAEGAPAAKAVETAPEPADAAAPEPAPEPEAEPTQAKTPAKKTKPAQARKTTATKKAPATKKAASENGAAKSNKKAAAKKETSAKPVQQQLPAEAHLLS